MYPRGMYIPNMGYNMTRPMMYGMGNMNFARGIGNGMGFMSGIGRGMGGAKGLGRTLGFMKNISWGGLLNNASKTLGIVNQTIPLVKQAGPMFSNMRSMLKLASAFKDETEKTKSNKVPEQQIKKEDKTNISDDTPNNYYSEFNTNENTPNFFL